MGNIIFKENINETDTNVIRLNENDVTLSSSESNVIIDNIECHIDGIVDGITEIDNLSKIKSICDNGEVNESTVRITAIALENIRNRLKLDDVKVSLESFKNIDSSNLSIATESIGAFIKKIIDAIIATIKKIWNGIVSIFSRKRIESNKDGNLKLEQDILEAINKKGLILDLENDPIHEFHNDIFSHLGKSTISENDILSEIHRLEVQLHRTLPLIKPLLEATKKNVELFDELAEYKSKPLDYYKTKSLEIVNNLNDSFENILPTDSNFKHKISEWLSRGHHSEIDEVYFIGEYRNGQNLIYVLYDKGTGKANLHVRTVDNSLHKSEHGYKVPTLEGLLTIARNLSKLTSEYEKCNTEIEKQFSSIKKQHEDLLEVMEKIKDHSLTFDDDKFMDYYNAVSTKMASVLRSLNGITLSQHYLIDYIESIRHLLSDMLHKYKTPKAL